jgi:molybdopterin converting factor subunit 1
MRVEVWLFARARDLAGIPALSVDLPEGARVAELRSSLIVRVPALAVLLPRCSVAVGEEFAGDDTVLSPNDEVAILPPISGGSHDALRPSTEA